MSNKSINFAVIGAGAMGSAIVKGLLKNKIYTADEVLLCDLDEEKLSQLKNELKVQTTNSYDEFKNSLSDQAMIMLAVKPQVFEKVLESLEGIKTSNPLISIAAGKKISSIEKFFPENEVFRVMPNTPAQISKAASALCGNTKATEATMAKVKEAFSSIGICVEVEEKDFDAVTALSGSGPAYIFLMTEAMTKAGEKLGLSPEVSEKLAYQTVYGAASLMIESQEKAQNLREKVTSPNGTTQAGIENLQANKLENTVFEALNAAKNRSIELN